MSGVLEIGATGAAAEAVREAVPRLVGERFASRLFEQDPGLWGDAAESEASIRLSWVQLHRSSRPLLGEIAALREELLDEGLDHVVLCGMGGSSLAPEVICESEGVPLTVLDSSQPDQVRAALDDRLDRAVVVVSSKSGSTAETDSQRRAFEHAFRDAGIDPTRRIVIVTDPGSPLDASARGEGYRVINADPHVGGRYSALTAFGLVPSGLAGADITTLLDDAEAVADLLADDDVANPGLRLGAAMAATHPLRDKLVLVDDGSGMVGFPDWAEQLVAESTGKNGTGLLPVVVADTTAPEVTLPPHDATVVRLVSDVPEDGDNEAGSDGDTHPFPGEDPDGTAGSEVTVAGSLGAQLLLWETATATAGRLLGINPFDQPDVESAKEAARGLLDDPPQPPAPDLVVSGIEVRALGFEVPEVSDPDRALAVALGALLGKMDRDSGYLAVMAYLDRTDLGDLEEVRETLAVRTRRPVTFGWGPRFLHSTGQLHKGGPETGVFLQITGAPVQDLAVPGRDFSFGELVAAQAAGDAQVLARHGRPVLRLHLTDVEAGLPQLVKALA